MSYKTQAGFLFFTVVVITTSVLMAAPHGHGGELPDRAKPLPIEPEFLMAEGMVLVGGGCFQMGDTFGDGAENEKPVHKVCLDDFYMDIHEVTQEAYKDVMGNNPSNFEGNNRPVEDVTWYNARDYCDKAGKRLPTEAEWEYAARSGGKQEKWAGTSIRGELGDYAWYNRNSGKMTHPVGQKRPNGLGLYDMSGNVWEWVSDWYDEEYYENSARSNPRRPSSGKSRVLRGGSWNYGPKNIRASNRDRDGPELGNYDIGFRCVRTQ